YSLLMGREFKRGQWSILLDFDNKADETSHNGRDLANRLNMDQYKPPSRILPPAGFITYSTSMPNKRSRSPHARR
ncbi:MAG: hypothetical protein ACKPKO_40720, partial [Candidatus Fonsibacter sp.]